jgi:predicted alpha/beta hydrolase family esterase
MNNCIIVHGGPLDVPESDPHQLHTLNWFLWVKKELEQRGIKTAIPSMPHPWNPIYDEYKAEFEKLFIDETSIVIGHSRGCAFLVRWLGETKRKVGTLVMVAPSFIPSGNNELKNIFYNFAIDPTIRDRVKQRIIFTSDTEDTDGKKSAEIAHEKLDCRVISLANHGHYTTEDMGGNSFPELIEAVLVS